MAVLQPAHVAAQLLLDPVGRLVERRMGLGRLARSLQDHALHHMGDDVAGEGVVVGSLAESHIGGDRPLEIFIGDGVQSLLDMQLESLAGIDLMTRDPDFHHILQFYLAAR